MRRTGSGGKRRLTRRGEIQSHDCVEGTVLALQDGELACSREESDGLDVLTEEEQVHRREQQLEVINEVLDVHSINEERTVEVRKRGRPGRLVAVEDAVLFFFERGGVHLRE